MNARGAIANLHAKNISILAALGILTIPTHLAAASAYTGNNFLEYCSSSRQTVYGYVVGWGDRRNDDLAIGATAISKTRGAANVAAIEISTAMMFGTCTPEGATIGQITDVFCKFLYDNPALRHQGASDLMAAAMLDAFPCK